jgi:hypothetical protein
MKNKAWILSLFLAITACKNIGGGLGGEPQELTPQGEDKPFHGNWLSDCVDLGGGDINRVYLEIGSDSKTNLAILAYASDNCTGAYVLKDNGGNDIDEPVYTQNITEETVTDVPANFFVLKIVDVNSSNVQYVVMYLNDVEFYELTGFTTPHDTWTQWQGEADVSQFATNPTTYDPTTFTKYHFIKSDLP